MEILMTGVWVMMFLQVFLMGWNIRALRELYDSPNEFLVREIPLLALVGVVVLTTLIMTI